MWFNGFANSLTLPPPETVTAEVAGLGGEFSVVGAIQHREASGRGQVIDVSLYEPLCRLLIPYVTQYGALGHLPQRTGSSFPDAAPRNLYRSADGTWIALSATSQRVFERLAAALGRPDLVGD